jgi:hypothetical protein
MREMAELGNALRMEKQRVRGKMYREVERKGD